MRKRLLFLLAPLLAVALVAGACGSPKKSDSSSTSGTTAAGATGEKITATLAGSGSTFQKSYDEAVIEAFQKLQPGVKLSYSGGGSGKGKTDLAQGVSQWAGTDSLVKDADVASYTKGLLYWPTVAGPITLSYNLSGVDKLTLDADTTAKIFQGEIKTWDDAAIKALNPDAKLPSTKISAVHRSDASGTTANFTKWLTSAATAGVAKLTAGDSNNGWPTDQVAGNGNAGVATAVKQTVGAIGYVDYSDAKASGLTFASVKNKAGKAVAPSLDGTSGALAKTALEANLTYNPLNADGDTSYPIATPTWIITQKTYSDENVVKGIKALLTYMYGDGQDLAKDIDFARLPDDYVTKAKVQLDQLTVG
jgi:phosphate transport system substrate-binding protein